MMSLGQTIASGPENWPDVLITTSQYYTNYAKEGVLWDMTQAWENSSVKKSGRIVNENVVDSLYIDDHLYGLATGPGMGCITYIKKQWLDNVGLDVPTNYEEYLEVLDAFTNGDPDRNGVDGDTFGVSAAALLMQRRHTFSICRSSGRMLIPPSIRRRTEPGWMDSRKTA